MAIPVLEATSRIEMGMFGRIEANVSSNRANDHAAFWIGRFFSTNAVFLAAFAAFRRFSAHRFFVAATILFSPSSLILRFGFDSSTRAAAKGVDREWFLARLALCAGAIFRATVDCLRLGLLASDVVVSVPPGSTDRSLAI